MTRGLITRLKTGGAMRTVLRRLRRIEARLAPRNDVVSQAVADLIRESRRRRLEAEGLPYEERNGHTIAGLRQVPLGCGDVAPWSPTETRTRYHTATRIVADNNEYRSGGPAGNSTTSERRVKQSSPLRPPRLRSHRLRRIRRAAKRCARTAEGSRSCALM
jgi:hypothetical protein